MRSQANTSLPVGGGGGKACWHYTIQAAFCANGKRLLCCHVSISMDGADAGCNHYSRHRDRQPLSPVPRECPRGERPHRFTPTISTCSGIASLISLRNCVTSKDYQPVPIPMALETSYAWFFIADDVDLGKTIEAEM